MISANELGICAVALIIFSILLAFLECGRGVTLKPVRLAFEVAYTRGAEGQRGTYRLVQPALKVAKLLLSKEPFPSFFFLLPRI